MTIVACWHNLKWQRVIGEVISLRGLKSLVPGNWINDEIINILIKRYLGEMDKEGKIHIMDTQFYAIISWDDRR